MVRNNAMCLQNNEYSVDVQGCRREARNTALTRVSKRCNNQRLFFFSSLAAKAAALAVRAM